MPNSKFSITEKDAISMDQAAELLGVCKKSLYSYVHTGELPTYKIGRRRLIRRQSFEEFQQRLETIHTSSLKGHN